MKILMGLLLPLICAAFATSDESKPEELDYKKAISEDKEIRTAYLKEAKGKQFLIEAEFWLSKDGRIMFVSPGGELRGSVAFSDKSEKARIVGATEYQKSESKRISAEIIATAAFRKSSPRPIDDYIAPPELVSPPRNFVSRLNPMNGNKSGKNFRNFERR